MSVVISNRNFIINEKVTKLKDEELANLKINYQKKPMVIPKRAIVKKVKANVRYKGGETFLSRHLKYIFIDISAPKIVRKM